MVAACGPRAAGRTLPGAHGEAQEEEREEREEGEEEEEEAWEEESSGEGESGGGGVEDAGKGPEKQVHQGRGRHGGEEGPGQEEQQEQQVSKVIWLLSMKSNYSLMGIRELLLR